MADQALPDLQTALASFVQGAKEVGTARALDAANQQVGQIKATMADGMQQRAALDNVARSLVMDMTARGANASTVSNVYGAIKPQEFGNAEQMILHGMNSGNKDLIDMGQTYQKNAQEMKFAEESHKNDQAIKLQKVKNEGGVEKSDSAGEWALKRAGVKSSQAGALKPIETKPLDASREWLTNLDNVQLMAKDLVAKGKLKMGPGMDAILNSPASVLDPELSTFKNVLDRTSSEYAKRMEGMRIPPDERIRLKARSTSMNQSVGQLFPAIQAMKKEEMMRYDTQLQAYSGSGKNTAGYTPFVDRASKDFKVAQYDDLATNPVILKSAGDGVGNLGGQPSNPVANPLSSIPGLRFK